jgi:hypothetical protein
MSGILRARATYVALLRREGVGWKIATTLWTIWTFASFFRDEIAMAGEAKFKFLNVALLLSWPMWLAVTFCFLSYWIFESACRRSGKQAALISELEKIDREDLCRLLDGYYIGDTFRYKAEIVLCKRYTGPFELSQLKDVFTEIVVKAPKHSWAAIDFGLSNSRQPDAKCLLYVKDGRGEQRLIENIYEEQQVYLDGNSTFSFKIVCEEKYVFHESVDLMITIEGWLK